MRIVYCGQFRDQTGYGVAARGYLKSFDTYLQKNPGAFSLKLYSVIASESNKLSDSDLSLLRKYEFESDDDIDKLIEEEYIFIWHMPPPLMTFGDQRFKPSPNCSPSMEKLLKASDFNVNFVAWETDSVPQEWAANYEYYKPDMIVVPCEWNREVFSKTGIECAVAPHVIENVSQNSKPLNNLPVNLDDKFVVLSSSQWTYRKGFDILLKAFFTEFGLNSDAVLVLKTYESATHNAQTISHEIKYYKNTTMYGFNQRPKENNVIVLPSFLSSEKISWLYEKASLFALTSRGEGFGLPISEALFNKVPVLVPKEGGHLDYIHPDAGFFVDGHWETCMLGIPPYECDSNYYESHIVSTREKLREAYNLWKESPRKLKKKGNIGHQHIIEKDYTPYNIGKTYYDLLVKLGNKKKENNITEKRKELKTKLSKLQTLQDKVDCLKDSFKGETCVILATGPSLLEYDRKYLKEVLKDKLVFAIKGAYDIFSDVSDFHFFNAANLPAPQGVFQREHFKYDLKDEPIIVASDNYPLNSRWSPYQKNDLFFQVPVRTEINDQFLTKTLKFEDYTLSNSVQRPCGPGIFYETVMYMAEHVGVSNIITLGFDLTDKVMKKENEHKHFYEDDKKFFIKGDVLTWEVKANRDATGPLHKWLKNKNITLQTASKSTMINEDIERVKL